MASAVRLRQDYSAEALRALGRGSKDVHQSRRLLSLAAVRDGMPDGLFDNGTAGPKPRLSSEQMAEVAGIVEAGPDREKDGVVRWRRIDLKRILTGCESICSSCDEQRGPQPRRRPASVWRRM